MKKITSAFVIVLCLLGLNPTRAQIKVTNAGNVGIGLGSNETPADKFHVNGNANITGALSSGNLTLTQTLNVNGSSYLKELSFGDYFTTSESPVGYGYGDGSWGLVIGGTALTPKYAYLASIGEQERPVGVIHAGELRLNSQTVSNVLSAKMERTELKEILFYNSPGSFGIMPRLDLNRYRLKPEAFERIEDKELRIFCMENARERYDITAESLAEYFPELVNYDEKENAYYVSYLGLIPYLVDALQESYARISKLEIQAFGYNPPYEPAPKIMSANRANPSDSSIVFQTQTQPISGTDSSQTSAISNPARLDQNVPNPFTQDTRITYYLDNGISQADLYVYNMAGAQIMHFPLSERGEGSLTIQAQALATGMYLYVLIADGVASEAKRMILTD